MVLLAVVAVLAELLTPWGENVASENAWRDYPRPQMVRAEWTCLNGSWDYAVTSITNTPGNPWDPTVRDTALARGKITVPFAIESQLSGVPLVPADAGGQEDAGDAPAPSLRRR